MDVVVNILLGMVGFLIGNLLFSGIGHWVAAVYEIWKDDVEAKPGRIVSVTLLSSGPWFVVVVAFVAYYIHSQPWALWIAIGAVTAIILFTGLGVYFARRSAQRGKANAA